MYRQEKPMHWRWKSWGFKYPWVTPIPCLHHGNCHHFLYSLPAFVAGWSFNFPIHSPASPSIVLIPFYALHSSLEHFIRPQTDSWTDILCTSSLIFTMVIVITFSIHSPAPLPVVFYALHSFLCLSFVSRVIHRPTLHAPHLFPRLCMIEVISTPFIPVIGHAMVSPVQRQNATIDCIHIRGRS